LFKRICWLALRTFPTDVFGEPPESFGLWSLPKDFLACDFEVTLVGELVFDTIDFYKV